MPRRAPQGPLCRVCDDRLSPRGRTVCTPCRKILDAAQREGIVRPKRRGPEVVQMQPVTMFLLPKRPEPLERFVVPVKPEPEPVRPLTTKRRFIGKD